MAPDINVQGNKVTVVTRDDHDFILLTDRVKHWLKNPSFNTTEFSSIRKLEDRETK